MSVYVTRRATLLTILSAIIALALMPAVQGCSTAPSPSQTAQGETTSLSVGRVTLDYPSAWGEAQDAGSTIVSGYTYADAQMACDGSAIKRVIWNVMDDLDENGDSLERTEHLIVGGGKTKSEVSWDSIAKRARDAMDREEQLDEMLDIISVDGSEVIKVTSTIAQGEGGPALRTASFMFEKDGSLGESIMVASFGRDQGEEDFTQIVESIAASMHVR